jgi:long-chain fatty acid transport protein
MMKLLKSAFPYLAFGMLASPLCATNGDQLIGVGAKSRGMAGVGYALLHGAESALSNPALIGGIAGGELFAGATLFMPNVAADAGGGSGESASDMSLIPELAVADRIDNGWAWGAGMFGTAGMGVDYSDSAAHMEMKTLLQLMQIVLPVSYRSGGLSIGAAPIIQYGSLDITYTGSSTGGEADDYGIGFNAGLLYRWGPVAFGAAYRSAIDMEYKDQLSKATADFGLSGFSDHLEQPYEYGIGLSYSRGAHTLAFDYRRVGWGDAKGYEQFGWENQNVYAVGYQYREERWNLRTGVNRAESPIREAEGTMAGVINTMNLLGFPAIVETHYAIGASYDVSPGLTVDAAYTYAPEVKEQFRGMMGMTVTTTHWQQAVTLGMVYSF